MTKYRRYQDYVIKDGKLIGEFEEMYQDFDDPWEQINNEAFAAEKVVAINAIQALDLKRVLEYGCGLGYFTSKIKQHCGKSVQVHGVDISKTAIDKAAELHSECCFHQGDILDFDLLDRINPEVIIFSEITWYVLDKLNHFKDRLKKDYKDTYFLHLLNFYPPGEQQYGVDYFTNLAECMKFFDMNYVEYGEITKPFHANSIRSYFLGRYGDLEEGYQI